jgi:hypothetical protein
MTATLCTVYSAVLDHFEARGAMIRRMVKAAVSLALVYLFVPFILATQISDLETTHRLAVLEGVKADTRLTAIETRLDGIERSNSVVERIGIGILIVVGGQLTLSGLTLRSTSSRRRTR